MLAKCSRCTQTFQTDRFGEQHCPFCGAAVMIAAPPTGAPDSAPTAITGGGAAGASDAQDQQAPLDDPASHGGWLSAFFSTWKKSVFEPAQFFSRLRVGNDWGGSFAFAAVCVLVGGVFVGLNTALQLVLQFKSLSSQAPDFAELGNKLGKLGPWLFLGMAIAVPVFGVVNILIQAGIYHLALMVVGGNKAGFKATVRAVGYAYGPYLFGIVPFCGSTVAGFWTLGLMVYALSKLHRITIGRSIGAWAVVFAVSCCCIGVPVGGIVGIGVVKAIGEARSFDGAHKLDLPPMDDLPDNP